MIKIIITSLILFFISPKINFAQIIEWSIQSHKKSGSILNKNFIKYIVEPVNKEFPNEFKINFFVQGDKNALHSNYSSFSSVRYGNVEGRFSATMYWGNADPVFAIIGDLTAAWSDTNDFINWYDEENGKDFFQKAYDKFNMKFVGFSLSPHESLVSNYPIRSITDIRKKVIRTPPGSMAEAYFNELGAIVRPFSMSKVSKAFELKKIDIADYSTIGVNLDEGLHKIAKHTNYPGFHSLPILEFVVNKTKWSALPKRIQISILKHTKIWQNENIKVIKAIDQKTLIKFKELNIHVYVWNEKELKKARIIASKVWDKYAKKSKDSKRLIDSIKKWLKKNNKL